MKNAFHQFFKKLCIVLLLTTSLPVAFSSVGRSETVIGGEEKLVEETSLIERLRELKNSNYLIDQVKSHDGGINVFLNKKTWNNPRDTKKIADSVALLMDVAIIPDDFKIQIMHNKVSLYVVSKRDGNAIVTSHYDREKSIRSKSSTGATKPIRQNPSKSQLRTASHGAVLDNCKCTIIEWSQDTFDYMRAEGNYWETLENFTSKGGEGIAKSLCAYVKLKYSPSTGKLSIVEVDYYSPDTCD